MIQIDQALSDQIGCQFFEEEQKPAGSMSDYFKKYDQRVDEKISNRMQKFSNIIVSRIDQLIQAKVQILL